LRREGLGIGGSLAGLREVASLLRRMHDRWLKDDTQRQGFIQALSVHIADDAIPGGEALDWACYMNFWGTADSAA